MKKIALLLALGLAGGAQAAPSTLAEGFNDVGALGAAGWTLVNNSSAPVGSNWEQGNAGIFTAPSGPNNSFAAASYLGTNLLVGDVSNWLITPMLTLNATSQLSFFVSNQGEGFLDKLEVRMSTNGNSANVGATPTSVGDFTTLLGSYSSDTASGWLPQSFLLTSLAVPTDVRLAFRYVVSDASINGNYLGIDSVSVGVVPEPAAYLLMGLGLAGLLVRRRFVA